MTLAADTTNSDTATEEPVRAVSERLADGSLTEIEVAWSDPLGHAQGKRIPAAQFLDRAQGSGFAFCEASLGWNADGTVVQIDAQDGRVVGIIPVGHAPTDVASLDGKALWVSVQGESAM